MKTVYEFEDKIYTNMSTLIKRNFPADSAEFHDYLTDRLCTNDFIEEYYKEYHNEKSRTIKEIIEDYYEGFVECIEDNPNDYDIIEHGLIED